MNTELFESKIQGLQESILQDRREQNKRMDLLIDKTTGLTIAVQTAVERDKMYEHRIGHLEGAHSKIIEDMGKVEKALNEKVSNVEKTLATVEERTKVNSESRVMITRVVLGVFASIITLAIVGGIVFVKTTG